eukprot:g35010.t1
MSLMYGRSQRRILEQQQVWAVSPGAAYAAGSEQHLLRALEQYVVCETRTAHRLQTPEQCMGCEPRSSAWAAGPGTVHGLRAPEQCMALGSSIIEDEDIHRAFSS